MARHTTRSTTANWAPSLYCSARVRTMKILGAVGLTLVTISHLIPIAMGYELVPAYIAADPAGQATLAATADTFAAIALVTNAAGNFLGFGVVVPLYAVAIHTTGALPRWIGWLGLLVGALAGWLGLLSPASSIISGISSIGFHRLLRFHAEHRHRAAPAPLQSRRSNPGISTNTELTAPHRQPLELTDPNQRRRVLYGVRDGAASVPQVIWAFGFSSRRAWRIYVTPSEDLPQMLLISDKSLPVSGHLANFARYWIWGRYRGRDSSRGGGLGLGRLESSWTCLLLWLDINPKHSQDQRDAKQGGHQDAKLLARLCGS